MRDMKKMKFWIIAAILLCGAAVLTSCNGTNGKSADVRVDDAGNDFRVAVDNYLVDSIGVNYAPGEVCIPCATILVINDMNPDSILLWGDYWVFNFNVVGDTLKTVSGGDHPGLMCIKKTEKGEFYVASFEQVEDGHGNEASARRIFGDNYNDFHAFNSNEEAREQFRADYIANYVKAHNLAVKYYQDYGWPAKEIPTE